MFLTEVATRDSIIHVYRTIDQSFDSKLSLKVLHNSYLSHPHIQDLAIKEKSVIVAWDGKQINEKTWRGEGQTVHIQVQRFHRPQLTLRCDITPQFPTQRAKNQLKKVKKQVKNLC